MKIYTKKGDTGKSSLYDGTITSKSDEIFDVLGTSDELTSNIGMLIALISERYNDDNDDNDDDDDDNDDYTKDMLKERLRKIQGSLQYINSELATPDIDKRKKLTTITELDVKNLEDTIDELENFNDKLTRFILPGVSVIDSQSHICRTITRRLERELCKINIESKLIMMFVNRLSDFFFVLARFICKKQKLEEFAI
jgi:cob(I)alamin adenosyltransferase